MYGDLDMNQNQTKLRRARLQRGVNAFLLKKRKVARDFAGCCQFCLCPIQAHQTYRGDAADARAHETCISAVSAMLKEKR
jgi:hypothetical protein